MNSVALSCLIIGLAVGAAGGVFDHMVNAARTHKELREYLNSWLRSAELNAQSEYHAGAKKVAQKALMILERKK